MLRAFVIPSGFELGGAAEPSVVPNVGMLVYSALLHVLLVRVAVAVHVVHYVLLVIALGGVYQENSS